VIATTSLAANIFDTYALSPTLSQKEREKERVKVGAMF
jgi:hypothetical protein